MWVERAKSPRVTNAELLADHRWTQMNTDEMACVLGINVEFLSICVHLCLSVVILHMFSVVSASLQMAADEPRTGAPISVPSWRMLPASEPTLAASATTVISAPVQNGIAGELGGLTPCRSPVANCQLPITSCGVTAVLPSVSFARVFRRRFRMGRVLCQRHRCPSELFPIRLQWKAMNHRLSSFLYLEAQLWKLP